MFDPDPTKKSKRPPPLPSFSSSKLEQPKKEADLDKKLDSFFKQISKQVKANKAAEESSKQVKNQQKQEPVKLQTVSQQGHQQISPLQGADKKKISLASINSKLNSMLSTKKINLNTIATKPVQPIKSNQILNPQKVQKKRNQLPGDYDPNTPNNYDLSKHFYSQKLALLQQESDEEEQIQPTIINKTGMGMQKIVDQMKSEQEIPEPPQQEEALEEKQQVALRMMQKFGYKVGTGLGKQSQGITTPLTIKKTTDSSCVIEQSSINLNQLIKPQVLAKNALMAHHVTATQVIVFINLIKFEDLTENVEKQLTQQCSSFGCIKKWMVFLQKNQGQGPKEVRIFVEYDRKEEAFQAFVKLNNRFYRQNLASIRFYPKDFFEQHQLYLPVHSHIET